MPEILTEPHALRRAYQAELGAFLDELEERLPDDRHRLRPAADRPEPGRRRCRATWRRDRRESAKMSCEARGSSRTRVAEVTPDAPMEIDAVTMPLVWALGFANAPLLYGLAAAGVPILIHLLNRRKFREVPWAAMRFLLAAIRKNQRRLRIEQWLLLAVRTLIILLVVAAMAKPFLEAFGAVIAGRRTHRVLVLDGSLSMGYTVGRREPVRPGQGAGGRSWSRSSRRGDAVSVILMGQPPRVVIGDPSPNLEEVEKEIGELTHHARRHRPDGHVRGGRPRAGRLVDRPEGGRLPDRPPGGELAAARRGTADGAEAGAGPRSRPAQPRSVVIDLGKSGGENRAVTDLQLDVPVVTVGRRRPGPRPSCATSAAARPTACGPG